MRDCFYQFVPLLSCVCLVRRITQDTAVSLFLFLCFEPAVCGTASASPRCCRPNFAHHNKKPTTRVGEKLDIRLWRRCPRPTPEEQALRSSGGVCEPAARSLRRRAWCEVGTSHTITKNRPQGSGRSWVFAYGEDAHALRLKSKLFDLRAGYANQQHAR